VKDVLFIFKMYSYWTSLQALPDVFAARGDEFIPSWHSYIVLLLYSGPLDQAWNWSEQHSFLLLSLPSLLFSQKGLL
jgi:hypothetical protein